MSRFGERPGRRRTPLRLASAALISSAALVFLPAALRAQQACAPPAAARAWPAPLDRPIAVRARDISLREALDRVAVAAHFHVSYSAQFLPLDRRVCLFTDSISAGDALSTLLQGVDVASIVTSSDQVVIAPATRPASQEERAPQPLERVVVTGSATGNAQRSLSVALDVLEGRKLDETSSSTLSAAFDGNVPGVWLWEQSPTSMMSRYGSIRGASSFNVSYPKVYVDGIEVANPLVLTDLNPAAIDRVEVIRGPQGAALYGADAISGVVNIVTRHEGLQAGANRTEFSSGAGLSQTAYADRSVLAQNHSLNVRLGSNTRSGSFGMNMTTLGGYVPDADSKDLKLNGGFRVVTPTTSVTGTARFYGKRATAGENPELNRFLASAASLRSRQPSVSRYASSESTESASSLLIDDSLPQTVQQYTVGGTVTLLSGTTWTPSFTGGFDGYRLHNVSTDLALLPSSLDSALQNSRGGADRGTMRASVVGTFDLAPRSALTLTFSAEHSQLRERVPQTVQVTTNGVLSTHEVDASTWRSNSGLVGQGNLSINDAIYLTGGLRVERNDGFTLSNSTVGLPMAGVAFVRDLHRLTVKLRGAYGVGIRPASSSTRDLALHDTRQRALSPTLDPERQDGTEFGADVMIGGTLGVHVTRFDQTASGLIQWVAINGDSSYGLNSDRGKPRIGYVLQNVGEITNRGWELSSNLEVGAITIGGSLATVDSRVRRTARGYTGDLRVGDRMLAVPATTASFSFGYVRGGWQTSLGASRAFDWVNYDRLRFAGDFAGCSGCEAENFTGAKLRSYWMKYDGVTRLRATVTRELPRNFSLRVSGDNLTNQQRGEPDNLTVLPGRTVIIGLTAKIR